MPMKKIAVTAMLVSLALLTAPGAAFAEAAVTHTAGERGLKWNDCPAFLPKGCGIAVLHGDPAQPNADVFLKVLGKSTLPLHTHSSAERMILVAGELHVTYEGQKMAVMKPGTYAYGPAKMPHSAVCVSAKPCILFIAFEGPIDAVAVETAAN